MQILTAIAVDDEPLALRVLNNHAEKIPFLHIVYSSTKVLEALSYIQHNPVDLIFLDIQMPDLTGLQFMDIIGDETRIILTTAYPQYAIDGFEYEVSDYLLKPIGLTRMLRAVQKVYTQLYPQLPHNGQLPTEKSIPYPPSEVVIDCIFIKTEYRLQKILFDEILYMEGGRDYVTVFTTKEKILTLTSLSKLQQSLPHPRFLRVHKSYIVAVNKIDSIERQRISLAGEIVPIGDVYKEELSRYIRY